jgi:hypothetical protein
VSTLIFPTFPATRLVAREPLYRTEVQRTDSGRELRVKREVAGHRYVLDVALRSWLSEDLTLRGFFNRHGGRHESFRFLDPYDNAVTDHGFGVGNAAATSFQLQRTLAGTVTDLLGTWPTYHKPRTNLILRSQEFDNASWSKLNVTVTANAAIAPDGTLTADKMEETAVSGQHLINQPVSLTSGNTYIVSVYVKAAERSRGELQLYTAADNSITRFNLATGTIVSGGVGGTATNYAATCTAIGNGWFRVTLSHTVGTSGSFQVYLALHDNAGTQSYLGVAGNGMHWWQAQPEPGTTATRPIVTTSAIVRQDPAYYPATTDGFERVADPIWRGVTIYKDGVAQAAPSVWSPGTLGLVSFAAAPASGVVLSWSGSYHRTVRFAEDALDLDYEAGVYRGTVELETVVV